MSEAGRVSPFSTGTQFLDWNNANCCRCARYHVENGEVVEPFCELEQELCYASIDDGTVSREIAERLGVPAQTWTDWRCKEFVPVGVDLETRIVPAPGQMALFPEIS